MPNARIDPNEELAHEIDRLRRQLPAEPIIGRAPPAYSVPHAPVPALATANGAPRRASRSDLRADRTAYAAHAALALVWTRVLLAAALGVALTQWPYARACGPMLYVYMLVIGAVLIAAGWAAVEAWRGRVAPAHMVSLVIGFWGIVLAAEQVLPRVGYAATTLEWTCAAKRPGR